MSTLKRLFFTVKSQIDSAADQFENHEALASAAIRDLQKIGSNTMIHLRHLQQVTTNTQGKLDALQTEAGRWEQRAVSERERDEQRALECVRRLQQCNKEISRLIRQLDETKKMEIQVKADLDKIQDRLHQLQKKKDLLSARQNRVEIMQAFEHGNVFASDDMQDVFSRWENSVSGSEFIYSEYEAGDSFAEDFERAENDQELKEILAGLGKKDATKDDHGITGEQS